MYKKRSRVGRFLVLHSLYQGVGVSVSSSAFGLPRAWREEQDIGLERSVIECSRGTGAPSPKYRLFLAEENVLVAWSVEDCRCRIVMGTMKYGAPEV